MSVLRKSVAKLGNKYKTDHVTNIPKPLAYRPRKARGLKASIQIEIEHYYVAASDSLSSQHAKYDGAPQDSLGDFVTFVCQEPSDVQQLQVRLELMTLVIRGSFL